jgi:hypothetical protein
MTKASATLHTDEELDPVHRADLIEKLNAHEGVHACSSFDKSPHLLIVEYNSELVTGHGLVEFANAAGVHAKMVG